jgi:hypothetical protein
VPNNADLYLWRAVEFEKKAESTLDFGESNAYAALANGYRQLANHQRLAGYGRVVQFKERSE